MLELGSDGWIEIVLGGAAQLGISLDENHTRLFAQHAILLMEWNRKLNLTAIVDPTEIAVKHFLDAIAPLKYIPSDGRLLDIGTGGGFPGIPLKIVRPWQPMTLIDGVRKKVNFVKHVIRELALPSIEACQIRAEIMGQDGNQPKFDVIVCRALSRLSKVVQWAGPLLAVEGSIIAYRGPVDSHDTVADAKRSPLKHQNNTYEVTSHDYLLPVLGDPRTVTVLKAKH